MGKKRGKGKQEGNQQEIPKQEKIIHLLGIDRVTV
jgi:hypothetical protein